MCIRLFPLLIHRLLRALIMPLNLYEQPLSQVLVPYLNIDRKTNTEYTKIIFLPKRRPEKITQANLVCLFSIIQRTACTRLTKKEYTKSFQAPWKAQIWPKFVNNALPRSCKNGLVMLRNCNQREANPVGINHLPRCSDIRLSKQKPPPSCRPLRTTGRHPLRSPPSGISSWGRTVLP